jgi:hypothetical protein
MRPLDAARVALALAMRHGVDDGIIFATLEVDRSADDGDRPGEMMWRAVLELLGEMRRLELRRGERLH